MGRLKYTTLEGKLFEIDNVMTNKIKDCSPNLHTKERKKEKNKKIKIK